jgi:hypothetical protein
MPRGRKIREVIDTIGQKAVLILGRFTEERKKVLEANQPKSDRDGFDPGSLIALRHRRSDRSEQHSL